MSDGWHYGHFLLEHLRVDNHLRPVVHINIIPYYLATCLCKMLQNRQSKLPYKGFDSYVFYFADVGFNSFGDSIRFI